MPFSSALLYKKTLKNGGKKQERELRFVYIFFVRRLFILLWNSSWNSEVSNLTREAQQDIGAWNFLKIIWLLCWQFYFKLKTLNILVENLTVTIWKNHRYDLPHMERNLSAFLLGCGWNYTEFVSQTDTKILCFSTPTLQYTYTCTWNIYWEILNSSFSEILTNGIYISEIVWIQGREAASQFCNTSLVS